MVVVQKGILTKKFFGEYFSTDNCISIRDKGKKALEWGSHKREAAVLTLKSLELSLHVFKLG